MSVNNGETPQNLHTLFLTERYPFCWESKNLTPILPGLHSLKLN